MTRPHIAAMFAALFCLIVVSFGYADDPLGPAVVNFDDFAPEEIFEVSNGRIEKIQRDGKTIYRWHLNDGQSSTIAIRPGHPLLSQLSHYDRFQLRFNLADGLVTGFGFSVFKHVNGVRQQKVHSFNIAQHTTPRKQWFLHESELARPYWFPWDVPEGFGREPFFRISALSLEPNSVIELADLRLVRGLIFLRPFYEAPFTYPIQENHDDGSVSYHMSFDVFNADHVRTNIVAKVISQHKHFKMQLTPSSAPVDAGRSTKNATFELTATISAASIAATKELYAEPLEVAFWPEDEPDAKAYYIGHIVRPITSDIRTQVLLGQTELGQMRAQIKAGNEKVIARLGLALTLRGADEFLTKKLLMIPPYRNWPSNGYPTDWRPGDYMPEAVNIKTGEREVGTPLSGRVWREYLAVSGRASENLTDAYLLTGDEKYAAKAVELFDVYAQQYQYLELATRLAAPWAGGPTLLNASRISSSTSYGTNWYMRWFCQLVSAVSDSPSWTAEKKQAFYHGFVVPYGTELMKAVGGVSNQMDITNHNLVLLGLVFKDPHLLYHALYSDPGVIRRMQDIDDDGFTSEGRPFGYQGAAMSEFIPAIVYLEHSGLDVEFDKHRVLEAVRMPYRRAALNDLVPSSGDSARGLRAIRTHLADYLVALFPEEDWLLKIGASRTLSARFREAMTGYTRDQYSYRELFDTKPYKFDHAGMAILRSGDTIDTQIMATLDYGRNIFHAANDRNQFSLIAFGKIFTQGVGSLYNVGSGGILKPESSPRQDKIVSFIGHYSLAHNVVVVDGQEQTRSVGKLLAWSPQEDYQVAVSRVPSVAPGVSHTRGMVLSHGVIILLDRMQSDTPHTYDFVYHNYGDLTVTSPHKAVEVDQPLGEQANYENLVDLRKLEGDTTATLTWDMARQYPYWVEKIDHDKERTDIKLNLWQAKAQGGTFYTAVTGMNNSNTQIMPDETPTLIQRVTGQANANFVTVLEPARGDSRVKSVVFKDHGVTVTLLDGKTITADLDDLLAKYPVKKD